MDGSSSMSSPGSGRFSPITPTDHAGYAWIASLLCLIFSMLTLIMRGHIKWRIYGMDDWFVAAATATQLAQVVALFVALDNGLGKASTRLSATQLSVAGQATYIAQLFFILSLCFAKCSVLYLMLRLIPASPRGPRVICHIFLGLVSVWGIASVVGLSVQCSSHAFIRDGAGGQCGDQFLRWTLIVAFDIVTEVVLIALSVYIVWPLQMSLQLKAQVVLAFAFRIPNAVLAGVHLHYVGNYVHATDTSLAIVPAIVWQQLELCWSLLSASIPNLKSFMKSFNSGFGLDMDLATYAVGSRDYGASYQLNSMKAGGGSQANASKNRDMTSFTDNLRPDVGHHSATVRANEERLGKASSIESGGSREMIIRKDVAWNVDYETRAAE